MKLNQISPWTDFKSIGHKLSDEVSSWLLEQGPITKRIKAQKNFKLIVHQDKIDSISNDDYDFIESKSEDFKIRKVTLLGDDSPMVYAESIIPILTIEKGLSSLGSIGKAPLGDILFLENLFEKVKTEYASFLTDSGSILWGRRAKYTVNSQPISVMEIFIL